MTTSHTIWIHKYKTTRIRNKIFELLDYYGGQEAMEIMERGCETGRKFKTADPWFCVNGKRRILDDGNLVYTACGKRQYIHVNERVRC